VTNEKDMHTEMKNSVSSMNESGYVGRYSLNGELVGVEEVV